MMFIASGGAAPLLTDGLIRGGGFITFSIISAKHETPDVSILKRSDCKILALEFQSLYRCEI